MGDYETMAMLYGWKRYEDGDDVIPPDNEQEWWYYINDPSDDWYNTAKEVVESYQP